MFSGGLQSIGSQKVKHNWSDWEHSTVYNKIILEINYVKVSINTTNSWKLYNTLLSKYLAKKKKKKKKYELNENKSTTYQNMWDAAKEVQ